MEIRHEAILYCNIKIIACMYVYSALMKSMFKDPERRAARVSANQHLSNLWGREVKHDIHVNHVAKTMHPII